MRTLGLKVAVAAGAIACMLARPLPARAKILPSPSPSPAASATSAPAQAAPSGAPPPNDDAATPIPTQPPTPRPVAPDQPTIPQSLADPNVRSILAHPIRELALISWMKGTWHVEGSVNLPDGKTAGTPGTVFVFAPIMNGRWMFGADGHDSEYVYLSYDPFARHWVAIRFSASPSFAIYTSSAGWIGNRIDFTTNFSYVNGRQYRRRLTIIHKDARTFGLYEQEQIPDGSWTSDAAFEFTKAR